MYRANSPSSYAFHLFLCFRSRWTRRAKSDTLDHIMYSMRIRLYLCICRTLHSPIRRLYFFPHVVPKPLSDQFPLRVCSCLLYI